MSDKLIFTFLDNSNQVLYTDSIELCVTHDQKIQDGIMALVERRATLYYEAIDKLETGKDGRYTFRAYGGPFRWQNIEYAKSLMNIIKHWCLHSLYIHEGMSNAEE